MEILLDNIVKYWTTAFHYCRLRPRRFYELLDSEEENFLPPLQFGAVSLFFTFILQIFIYGLSRAYIENFSGYPLPNSEALAASSVIFQVLGLAVISIFYWVISGWWPIRGRQSQTRYIQLICYETAVWVPLLAMLVLQAHINWFLYTIGALTPSVLLYEWIAESIVLVVFLGVIYEIPAIAHVNNVSSPRMLFATVLWTVAAYLFITLMLIVPFWYGYTTILR